MYIHTYIFVNVMSYREFSYIQYTEQQMHLIKYNKIFNCILLSLFIGQYI
jgi:hypothetical protein